MTTGLASSNSAQTSKSARVPAIDLTKGALVVCMVIYHSFNYSTERHLGFRYLAFLPPSFIVITGYLLSQVYLKRYSPGDWSIRGRLIVRGARLLILFTLLNVLVQILIGSGLRGANSGLAMFLGHWFETYALGNGRMVAFEVLVPIAYLLLLAPVLFSLESRHTFLLPGLTLSVVVCLVMLERRGITWLNPQLLSAGLVGMWIGRIPIQVLERLYNWRWAALLVYSGWFVIGYLQGQTYVLQLLGALLALAAIYAWMLGLKPDESWLVRRLEVMGRYSLVSYIAQIGILQVLSRLIGNPPPLSFAFLSLLLGTLALTTTTADVLDWFRRRSTVVDGVYRAVFA